jgi:hypothetical protein
MVKFSAKMSNGKTLVGLGIVRANVMRMMNGMPMEIPFGHVIEKNGGVKAEDVTLMIFYGETEEEIQKTMQDFIGPQTHFVDHRKPKT